ncbi:PilZ domain-containing protein [Klebsiella electrica]|uniref:flagellar brake protein n=1 Tax=Klebsiella electrica TaxID=1259973 RepID=UPI0025553DDE|nr:PilZ domain-containing protein [Klebsiella electrica]WIO41476.1 PilZ domain-containing protein [Klebsiella electrica]
MKKHDKKNGVSALSEDNVSEGFSKNAKYEILAILREELRIQSKVYLYCNGERWQTTLKRLDGSTGYLNLPFSPFLSSAKAGYYFIIYSPTGKIEFTTNSLFFDSAEGIYFFIPDTISVVQRRIPYRIKVDFNAGFYCSGRYKNGTTYKYELNDISAGGCSFISPQPLSSFIKEDNNLSNVELNLGPYGKIITHLKIKNILPVNDYEKQNEGNFKVSCMFLFSDKKWQSKTENIVFQLLIESKLKMKRFLI